MRVNNQIIANTVLQNLNRNLEQMNKLQNQMSSGKKISRPSDDPIGIAQVLSYKTVLGEQEQHIKNMRDAKDWLDATESALNNATAVLQNAREIAVYGANGTMPQESLNALAADVAQLIDETLQVANSNHAGRYLFGGSRTDAVPFKNAGVVTYAGDGQALNWEVSPGVTIQVNAPGEEVFGDSVSGGVFAALEKLHQQLLTGNSSVAITDLEQAIDHLLEQRASLGAKSNRLELAISRQEEAKINVTKLMANLEDVDLAEVTMNFKMQEYVYQAALATAAKVLQPNLIDFLR